MDRHAIGGSNWTGSEEEQKGCATERNSQNRPISGAIWNPRIGGDY